MVATLFISSRRLEMFAKLWANPNINPFWPEFWNSLMLYFSYIDKYQTYKLISYELVRLMCYKSVNVYILSQWMFLTQTFCFWEVPAWIYVMDLFSGSWHFFLNLLIWKIYDSVIEAQNISFQGPPKSSILLPCMENNSSSNAPKSKTFSQIFKNIRSTSSYRATEWRDMSL